MAIKKKNHLLPADVWIVAYNLNSHISAIQSKNQIRRSYYRNWLDYKVALEQWQLEVQYAKKAKEVRHTYIKALRNLGWTLESIAEAFSVTRERVRQLSLMDCPPIDVNLDLPLPMPPEKPERVKRTYPMPDEDTLARLKELHDKAKLVRSSHPANRKEAEEFTYLLNHLVNVEKFPAYRLSRFLGVTSAALNGRLIRYGYKTTTGTSRAYKPTINRVRLH